MSIIIHIIHITSLLTPKTHRFPKEQNNKKDKNHKNRMFFLKTDLVQIYKL